MGRIQTGYTFEELAALLGMPRHARLDAIDVDHVTRVVHLVWRSDRFIEIDEDDGVEPPPWSVGVLKADAEREKFVNASVVSMAYGFPEHCPVPSCVLGRHETATHRDAAGNQWTYTLSTWGTSPPEEVTIEVPEWISEVARAATAFFEERDDGDEISDYGVRRDAENGFGISDAMIRETAVGVPTSAHEAATCPECSGGVLRRETGDIRLRAATTYRMMIGGEELPPILKGVVLVCIDCGERRPIDSRFEVVDDRPKTSVPQPPRQCIKRVYLGPGSGGWSKCVLPDGHGGDHRVK